MERDLSLVDWRRHARRLSGCTCFGRHIESAFASLAPWPCCCWEPSRARVLEVHQLLARCLPLDFGWSRWLSAECVGHYFTRRHLILCLSGTELCSGRLPGGCTGRDLTVQICFVYRIFPSVGCRSNHSRETFVPIRARCAGGPTVYERRAVYDSVRPSEKGNLGGLSAANLLDRVFESPSTYGSLEVLATVYGYALQIYGDFSGYTDIAIGVALLLGFALPPNFNLPYRANGLQDFWRRWHISLSTWLRDYLYIPLGGSRGGRVATYRNLFITMLLGGLWHGASWNFVIWGAFHGLGLAVWRMSAALWTTLHARIPVLPSLASPAMHGIRIFLTFHFVAALWVFFRADSFDSACEVFTQLFSMTPGASHLSPTLLAVLGFGYLIHFAPLGLHGGVREVFIGLHWALQAMLTVSVLWALRFISLDAPQQFIYFQF